MIKGTIFKAKVGSHAYGTNVEGSDIDIKGIYIQDPEDIAVNGYREQETINKDEVYFELRRFVDLAAKGNPTVLELLFSPEDCIIYEHPLWARLKDRRMDFLSRSCKYSFGGYAYSQIEKASGLEKKMNWEKEKTIRKAVLDFCYVLDPKSDFNSIPLKEYLTKENKNQKFFGLAAINHFRYTYAMFYDYIEEIKAEGKGSSSRLSMNNPFKYKGVVQDEETSNDISLSDIASYAKRDTIMYFNKDGYQQHCKDYKSYLEWLEKRNTQRYVDIEGHGQKIDGKNLLHCMRLIDVGTEIALGMGIVVRRPDAEYLKGIRLGKHNLESIQDTCRMKLAIMDGIYDNPELCKLPHSVERGPLMKIMTSMRLEYLKAQDGLQTVSGASSQDSNI